jgi:hypothetical protein
MTGELFCSSVLGYLFSFYFLLPPISDLDDRELIGPFVGNEVDFKSRLGFPSDADWKTLLDLIYRLEFDLLIHRDKAYQNSKL